MKTKRRSRPTETRMSEGGFLQKWTAFLIFTTFSGLASNVFAALNTQTLPAGVRSPSIRFGMISQLDQKYADTGHLAYSVDLRSVEFNSQRLMKIEPKVKRLVDLFNSFGRQEMGSKLNLGTLRIDSRPEIQYAGLIFAYGVNDRWTLGFGAPVVSYKNSIRVSKTASNIGAFVKEAEALNQPEVDEGLKTLAETDVVQAFHSELRQKGYDELTDQNQKFFGDLQIASLYRLDDFRGVETLLRVNVNLPTGPKFNADNLAALNQFGYTFVEPQVTVARPLSRFKFSGLLGARYYLPDQVTVRVPKDQDDLLPDASQRESVHRQIGLRWAQSVQIEGRVTENFNLFALSEWSQKAADRFQGNRDGSYEMLSEGTEVSTQVVTVGLGYSSVASYLKSKKGIPGTLAFQVSDTVAGKNTERQFIQELNGALFF